MDNYRMAYAYNKTVVDERYSQDTMADVGYRSSSSV